MTQYLLCLLNTHYMQPSKLNQLKIEVSKPTTLP